MTNPLENAKKRLAALRAEIADVERFVAMYATFSEGTEEGHAESPLGTNIPNSEETFAQKNPSVNSGEKWRRVGRKSATPGELVEVIRRVIREVGRPMTRGEIVDALLRRDVEFSAQDHARYIGTIMWRHKSVFLNVEGRGYWLRGEPLDWRRPSGLDVQLALNTPGEDREESSH